MNIEAENVRLRALEPEDVEIMYSWENDANLWGVSGTIAPFSRMQFRRFIDEQSYDIYATRQLRLVVERKSDSVAVGVVDLFEFDPQNLRAGVGVMIHSEADRGCGYAKDALVALQGYCRDVLMLRQMWCGVAVDNGASLALFESLGYERVGVKRDWQQRKSGVFVDEVMFQKLL